MATIADQDGQGAHHRSARICFRRASYSSGCSRPDSRSWSSWRSRDAMSSAFAGSWARRSAAAAAAGIVPYDLRRDHRPGGCARAPAARSTARARRRPRRSRSRAGVSSGLRSTIPSTTAATTETSAPRRSASCHRRRCAARRREPRTEDRDERAEHHQRDHRAEAARAAGRPSARSCRFRSSRSRSPARCRRSGT